LGIAPYEGKYTPIYQKFNWLDDDFQSSLVEVKESLEELIDFAYKHRHELFVVNARIKSANERVRSAKGDYYPSVFLGARYTQLDAFGDDSSLSLKQ